MRSKESESLFKAAKEIRVAVLTDGDRIGGLLNEQHPLPIDEGEPAFDYRKHMKHLVHQLDQATHKVTAAEDAHSARRIRLSRFLGERNESVEVNYGKLVTARDGLETLYKSGGFELGFLKGDTPRIPEQLHEQLVQTVKRLREPAVEPRELKTTGFSVDLETVATDLETDVPALRAAIDRADKARKRAEGTLVVKRQALTVLRRTILWVGRTAEGLFHLAGEDELAKRIRTSTRRPLRPSEQAEESASEEEAESSSQEESPPENAAVSAETTS